LQEGLDVLKSWGFEYKTIITWVKKTKNNKIRLGMGYYFRNSTEHILFGVKGKMHTTNNSTKNIVEYLHNHMQHSVKPKEFNNFIVFNSGNLPRIELFARSKCDGWDVWGDEIE